MRLEWRSRSAKLALAATAFAAVLLVLSAWRGWRFALAVSGLLAAASGVVVPAARELRSTGPALKRSLGLRLLRGLRAVRGLCRVPPALRVLHLLALSIAVVLVSAVLVTGQAAVLDKGVDVLVALLSAAAVLDLAPLLMRLGRTAWARPLGKVAIAGGGGLIACLASAWAKHAVHGVTHADPRFFPDVQAALVVVSTPLFYAWLALAALSVASATLLLFAGLLSVVAIVVRFVGEAALGTQGWSVFTYRLVQGKRPPPGHKPGWSSAGTIAFMRLLSWVLFAMLASRLVVDVVQDQMRSVDRFLPGLIVAMEYRQGSACQNVARDSRVAYLDADRISVASGKNGEWTFQMARCLRPG